MHDRTEPGQIIAGKYELVRQLGHGSMGEVWVAHHCTLGEEVALKLLTTTPASGEGEDLATASARFLFEAQVAARLSRRTPHIVRVTDHGDEEGIAYLVMELLEGETLEARLVRARCLALGDTRTLVWQTSRALTEAHEAGVIHRDLKPANIFLTTDEDGRLLVKVLDFGIAYATHAHRRRPVFTTANGAVFGTPGYMSPEQASPSCRLDLQSDLWALGAVVYEALTSERPFAGTTIEELLREVCTGTFVPVHERDPSLPAGLADFFERAFARRPEDRHPNAHAFALAFDDAIVEPALRSRHDAATMRSDTPPPSASPVTTQGRSLASPTRPRDRRAVFWIGVAVCAPALLGLAAVQRSTASRADTSPPVSSAAAIASAPFVPKPAATDAATVWSRPRSGEADGTSAEGGVVKPEDVPSQQSPAALLVPTRPERPAAAASPISPTTRSVRATTAAPSKPAKPIDRDEVL